MLPICLPFASGSRRTAALAAEIATGTGAPCHLIDVSAITPGDWAALDAAPAIVMGSPTYMGGFTIASHPSGDKLMALLRLTVFAMQMRMIWVGQAEIGAPAVPSKPGINRDGAWLGVMATDPADPPDGALLGPGDAETARRYGARIAAASARWHG